MAGIAAVRAMLADPRILVLDEATASATLLGGLAASGWHSCCLLMRLLADGGCIYTLGRQDGTVLRGNLLHDVHYSPVAQQSRRSNNGIFFDQGSKAYLVEDNVIYDTSGEPVRFNQCKQTDLTWLPNSLGIAPGETGFPQGIAAQAGPVSD